MLTFFQALILGLVEGITEFLPISSTGHLIITSSLLNAPTTSFTKSFEIIIQLGAIAAVAVLYAKRLWVNAEVLKRVVVAFIPTGLIGFLVYKIVKHYFLGNVNLVLWSMLIGGILIILFEKWHHEPQTEGEKLESISYGHALIIGLCQSLAVVPGVSRSATTILGGLWLGYKRQTIVEFSFLLAIPTMLAATGLDVLKNARTISQGGGMLVLVLGFVVSFVVALVVVRWLIGFIQKNTFIGFGIYRVVAAVLGFVILP